MKSTLIVRDVDSAIVEALAEAAARHGRSPEEEHREILEREHSASLVDSHSSRL
jgi:plasmid stability protein